MIQLSDLKSRLADAQHDKKMMDKANASPVVKASRTGEEKWDSQFRKENADRSTKQLHAITAQVNSALKSREVKETGKSPLSSTMTPIKGK